jgi:hypothetical protein
MSDELKFDMPEDELFDELLTETLRYFHSMVTHYHRSTSEMYPDPQEITSSINVASLAFLGVARLYDLGGAVICEDVSHHASGRAADKMIHEAAVRAKELMGGIIGSDPGETLH